MTLNAIRGPPCSIYHPATKKNFEAPNLPQFNQSSLWLFYKEIVKTFFNVIGALRPYFRFYMKSLKDSLVELEKLKL